MISGPVGVFMSWAGGGYGVTNGVVDVGVGVVDWCGQASGVVIDLDVGVGVVSSVGSCAAVGCSGVVNVGVMGWVPMSLLVVLDIVRLSVVISNGFTADSWMSSISIFDGKWSQI